MTTARVCPLRLVVAPPYCGLHTHHNLRQTSDLPEKVMQKALRLVIRWYKDKGLEVTPSLKKVLVHKEK